MRNFYLLALALLLALSASGQKMKTAVADRYYEDFQFLAAAQAYERIIKTDTRNVAVMEKLVHCYTRLNDPVKSQFWLSKVLKTPQAPPKSYKTFATLLAANGKYEEASQWFDKSYAQTRDEESLRWLNTYRNLQQFYADSALYQISKVHFNSKYADFSPTFYQEGVVFSSARDNGKLNKMKFEYNNTWFIDLYFVKDTLAKPVPFSDVLNSKYHEGPLSFTPDQKTVFFTRNNHLKKSFFSSNGISKLKIYYASVYNGRWDQIREFNLNNKEYSVGQPALASDKLMYFVSDMPGGFGGTDLYRTEKVNDVWQKPVNLGPEINTSGNEMFPFVGEGDMLYFASNGHPGLGGLDVFFTAVSGTDFSPVTNLGYPVNTARDDFGFIIRNNHGYFSSNRDSKTTNDDIYRFKVSQSHPVMVVAREKTGPAATDSLSGAQAKEAALVLAQTNDSGLPAATKPEDELAEEGETGDLAAAKPGDVNPENKLEENGESGHLAAATPGDSKPEDKLAEEGESGDLAAAKPDGQKPGEDPMAEAGNLKAAIPVPDDLAGAGSKSEVNEDSLAAGATGDQRPGVLQKKLNDLLLAASPANQANPQGLSLSPEETSAGLQDQLSKGQVNTSNPEMEGLPGTLQGTPSLAVQADPEEENRNTFGLQAEAAVPETAGGQREVAAAVPETAGGQAAAAATENLPDPAADAAAEDKSLLASGDNSTQADSLAAEGNAGDAVRAASREDLASRNVSSGEKEGDAQASPGFVDPKLIGNGLANKEEQDREAGPGQVLGEPGALPAGEGVAGEFSSGKRAGETEEGVDAAQGSRLASEGQDQEEGRPQTGEPGATGQKEALATTAAVKRVKALPKAFKTGSVGEVIELEILYDLDKTTIRPDAAHVLNGLVAYMKKNPNVKVELGAHTDVRGSDNYNERLSLGRAESVVDYLARHGISRNRLVAVGFGEKDLALAAASNEAEHQVNRRTTARIFANEALLKAYHETVTQPKLAAIRARKQEEQASRLASEFPLFPDQLQAQKSQGTSGGERANQAPEAGLSRTREPMPLDHIAPAAAPESEQALAASKASTPQPRSVSLQAAAEDGVSFETEAPVVAPVSVYTREMLFWNPNATDPREAAARAKKNPDTFFIISNAFLSLVEAEWYVQEVLDLGGEGRIIMPFAGSKLYRVAVAGYQKYSEAARQLPAKKQVFGSHSWILGLNSREFALRRMVPGPAAPQDMAAAVGTLPASPAPLVLPAAAQGGSSLLASANALIATLERRIEGLESRLADAEAGALRRMKAAVHAPRELYDKVVDASRHRASARLWAEVAPHTIGQKTGRAYIVSGSFSTLGSANWYRKKMARMGGDSRIILPNGSNRLYIVTVADYAGRSEARQKLMSLKKTFGLYIWILDY